jgi:integration host factor subunit beta
MARMGLTKSRIPSTISVYDSFGHPAKCLRFKDIRPNSKGVDSMTKADLVDKVTALGDLTRRDGEIIVETLFESVIGALKAGDKIEIRGFGSFRTRQRNARIGRNPKTGDKVDVPAKRVPFFKPSKELRDSVNAKPVDPGAIDPHHPPAM